METKVPYNYINLVCFLNLLKYENTRKISLSNLKKYRELVLKRVSEIFKSQNIIFSRVNDLSSLYEFLNKYPEFVFLKDSCLYLNDAVVEEDIIGELHKIQKEEGLDDRYDVILHQRYILNELGISKVFNSLVDYWNLEKKIEQEYMEFSFDRELSYELKRDLLARYLFLINFKNASKGLIEAIKNTSTSICFDEDDYDYDDFPVSFENVDDNKHYLKDKDELFDDVSDSLYWIYQYAIFGDSSLASQKLWKDIDDIYMYELDSLEEADAEFDYDESCFYEEVEKLLDEFDNIDLDDFIDDSRVADQIFYLTYICKLDNYLGRYGEDNNLLKAKKRLLYTLDNLDLCLFSFDDLSLELENILEDKNEVSFESFQDEARFMADEVFSSDEDKNTIKKLLFISTYYDLSGDEIIKEIIDDHSEHQKYPLYKNIVLGEQKQKRKI